MNTLRFTVWLTFCFLIAQEHLPAGPRDSDWKTVGEAREKDQPKTVIALLRGIEEAAFADESWAEGARAMASRIAEEAKIEGNMLLAVKSLDGELAGAPEAVGPVLRTLSATWLHGYYHANRWRFLQRSQTGASPGEDIESWDLARILTEIDGRFQRALTDGEALKQVPVAEFAELLSEGELDDSGRPTVYDFLAHAALEFYGLEETAVSRPADAFEFSADPPALGTVEEFVAWQPETKDQSSPKLRALRILQDLLRFHEADVDRTAFLSCDLERIRWAGRTAVGESRAGRLEQALQTFIGKHGDQSVSAWARLELAGLLRGDQKTKEAHAQLQAGAEAFPEHPFGKLCANGVAELEARQLSIATESHWTPAGEVIRVDYRNLKRVWFRLYSVKFAPGNNTMQSDPLPELQRWLPAMLKEKPARAWDSALEDNGDYRSRQAHVLPPEDLPTGYHVLVASAAEDFALTDNQVMVTGIHLTPLAMTVRTEPASRLEGFVVDAVTGDPLPGVEVRSWIQQNDLLRKMTAHTNREGFFSFGRIPESRNYLVVASRGLERAVVRGWSSQSVDLEHEPLERVVLFTDRALYRPGQTVHFKGIWFRVDGVKGECRALTKRKGAVALSDPNGREVATLEIVTNDKGAFSGTFTAPEGSVLGQCAITMEGGAGAAGIRIEEYKRPKFQVTINAAEGAATLGQEVRVKAAAEAYTGAPVGGAKVAWRVTRRTRWPEWIRSCWWYQPRNAGAQEIAHGVAETDAAGEVAIPFTPHPDLKVPEDVEPVFEFEVTVDVTDGAGETRSARRVVAIGYTSLRATVTADAWLEAGTELNFRVRTESHDGEGRHATGTLKIYRLKEPEGCPRPASEGTVGARFDDFGAAVPGNSGAGMTSTDPDRWELGELVAEVPVATGREKTDTEGVAEVKRTLEGGAYRLVFETKDANGRLVRAFRGIQVIDLAAERFPTRMPFFTSTPSWVVSPGESFTLVWGSGHEKARACVEWFQDRKLLKREWSAPGRTQQVFRFPVDESRRGGITVVVQQVTMNRSHLLRSKVEVPWSNKELHLRWEHIVSKLAPGSRETWTAVVEGPEGEAAAAEMVAGMYDASLDAYQPHRLPALGNWWRDEPDFFYDRPEFSSGAARVEGRSHFPIRKRYYLGQAFRSFPPALKLFGGRGYVAGLSADAMWDELFLGGGSGAGGSFGRTAADFISPVAFTTIPGIPAGRDYYRAAYDVMSASLMTAGNRSGDSAITRNSIDAILNNPYRNIIAGAGGPPRILSEVTARKNLHETAFFFPHLTTDEKGLVRINFTMPEALTRWRFLGLAHDEKMRVGTLEGEVVTSKDLMVQPNPPRFLREGDAVWFTVRISNQGDQPQSGTAMLSLADAATEEDRSAALGITVPDLEFTVPAKENRTLKWRLTVPDGTGFLRYKVVAATGSLSDGEEGWLPVIPRRILVTESIALPIRGVGTKNFEFAKLLASGASETIEDRFLHVQVVSQPAWYAVMALPNLMEFPHECAEQTFNRYYANALARHIAKSDPKIRRIFELWKGKGTALDSPLMKNEDLKGILLEETPWLREARDESEARRRVGSLFDENHLERELDRAMQKLTAMQGEGGLWPWFPGGRGDEFISRYVATGFGRLRALGVETDITPALNALPALDGALTKHYEDLQKQKLLEQDNLSPWVAHHLYMRTMFLKDSALRPRDQAAFEYFAGQAREHWAGLGNRMSRAHVALALHRMGEQTVPRLVTRSLREHALIDEESGMRWNDPHGWWWWEAPVETQARMIEAFREIDRDEKAVEDCQVWLLKQKQVQDWKTTKATADAVDALLRGGRNLLGSDARMTISLGGEMVEFDGVEAGTGFYEKRFAELAVKPAMGKIALKKTDDGVGWASVHWQYLEDMAKVTIHEASPLKLEKSLLVRKNTDQGSILVPIEGVVKVGDELVTRLVLKNDQAMEYLHLKDLRGSGTEPMNVLSGYRWQDGFGYYEVTRDTASHFFIDRLPPGTHVFETSMRVQLAGEFQTGVADIQCMYAPEFNAHSGSIAVKAE